MGVLVKVCDCPVVDVRVKFAFYCLYICIGLCYSSKYGSLTNKMDFVDVLVFVFLMAGYG